MDQQHVEQILSKMEFEMKVAIKSEQIDRLLKCLHESYSSIVQDYLKSLAEDSPVLKSWTEQAMHNLSQFCFIGSDKVQNLANEYFDTPDDALFHRFSAGLRLRRSSLSEQVEQTIKLKGAEEGSTHSHLEFNVYSQQPIEKPLLSLFEQEDIPAGLKDPNLQSQLQGKYKTDFKRTTLELMIPLVGKVELALDQGEITSQGKSTPISEMELELKQLDSECFKLPACAVCCSDADATSVDSSFEVYDLDDLKLFLIHNTLLFIKSLNHRMLLTLKAENQIGQIFGLEPFSKLKRAVLLKVQTDLENFKQQHPDAKLPEKLQKSAKSLQVEHAYRQLFERLKQHGEYNPSILDYMACGEKMMQSFFESSGKVKLFNDVESLRELQTVLQDCINFAQESWFFKDADDSGWDEQWGICSLFKRQSFWGCFSKRFMFLADELQFAVDGVLEEQNAPESSFGHGTLPFSRLFYSVSPKLTIDLPFLVHFMFYCCRRYILLLQLQKDPEAFQQVLKATSIQLSYIFSPDLVKRIMSVPSDTVDFQRLFEKF